MIVYVTTGERAEYMEARRRALADWTREVLEEMRRPWGARLSRLATAYIILLPGKSLGM